jgi:hypothetical protein
MSIRVARPGPGPGQVWPAELRVVPAHGLRRWHKPGPVCLFRAGPARNGPALRVHAGGPKPTARPSSLALLLHALPVVVHYQVLAR